MRYLDKYLDEFDDRPTQIARVIGDVCGLIVYTLYAALR